MWKLLTVTGTPFPSQRPWHRDAGSASAAMDHRENAQREAQPVCDRAAIGDVLPAPPDSTFSAEKFVLGTVGLNAAIRKLERETGGSLGVLGTWHNHLVASGPSGVDAATAAKLALRQYLPVLLLIALPEGYTCIVAEAFSELTPPHDRGEGE